ncbi:hypothetical protein PV729_24855 [Streptomyces europaeiscabiei]|uniref:Integral membrane protein n=1 Tax=Streptomyces europaeiscabiei TaxID=146819 RepID=A0ABU4NI16_9ACTN|nr:hypothetical protein [Streptomyces europaeiscabiei]MDX3545650.1 hypothetical protein [Streptomyces europaeiscabiei]MDX3554952.1 hypothetical protein [Streptomyces europaeiscabiei]MDX3702781.1 hypothetical protein [Streptomyces europaeiscabiei]
MVGADWALFVVSLVFLGLPAVWIALLLVLGWSENGWGNRILRVLGAFCLVATAVSLAWYLPSRNIECRQNPTSSACVPIEAP